MRKFNGPTNRSSQSFNPSVHPLHPQPSSFSSEMDSFTDIAAYLEIDNAPPTNGEDGGSGGGTYCVVFAKEDLPSNEEGDGGSGGGTYCVVA
jgi:hypothetical protein